MDSLLVELQSQIDLGDTLVENCRNILSHVSGISKFESRINAELKFLKPLLKKTSKHHQSLSNGLLTLLELLISISKVFYSQCASKFF